VPSVASTEALNHAIAAFDLDDLELAIEPSALAAARRFVPGIGIGHPQVRLHLHRGRLIIDLPEAGGATVPHRPDSWSPQLAGPAGRGG
jgi:hypothetical protein